MRYELECSRSKCVLLLYPHVTLSFEHHKALFTRCIQMRMTTYVGDKKSDVSLHDYIEKLKWDYDTKELESKSVTFWNGIEEAMTPALKQKGCEKVSYSSLYYIYVE